MADLSITPVATQIRPVPQMSLADMVGLARGVQAYQQAQQINPVELATAQQQLSRLQQLTPEEIKRAAAEAMVAEKTAQPRIETAQSAAKTAATQLNTAQLENLQKQQANFSRESLKLLNRETLTPTDINDFLTKTLTNAGANEQIINQAKSEVPQSGSTAQMKAWLARHSLNSLTAEAQLERLFPSAQMMATGAELKPVTMGSPFLAMQPPGTAAGTSTDIGLPPTTQVVTPTGQTQYLGPLSQRGAAAPAGPLVSGLGPQQTAGLTGAGQVAAQDWQSTYNEGRDAGPRIATFQNIKKLVPESFTGVGAEKKQFASGLAQAVGIPLNVLEASSTEELAKNTKILQLAGGNTDAARQIAELANPNTKMTKEGILRVTNQLIGIEKLKQARSNFLQPFAADAAQYQQKASQFNQVADPRLFQEANAEDVAKMKAAMSPAERQAFGEKVRLARQLGVI
jgi:hypothetical protein